MYFVYEYKKTQNGSRCKVRGVVYERIRGINIFDKGTFLHSVTSF